MKANEAPEKIYCESDGLGYIDRAHNIKWPDDEAENIEYIRKDAFIEKALTFIRSCTTYDGLGYKAKCVDIEKFKNYMKGE
jgi:hypothetical protein